MSDLVQKSYLAKNTDGNKKYIINKTNTFAKSAEKFIRKLNTAFNRHYVLIFIIMLTMCCIVNWYWFDQMDPNGNPDEWAFNRMVVTKTDADGSTHNEFLSNSMVDSLYFSFTTFSTVGYGDVTPKSSMAKTWVGFLHGSIILFTYKLFEYYMNIDKDTNESALYMAYAHEHNDNIKLRASNYELESQNTELRNNVSGMQKTDAIRTLQRVAREKLLNSRRVQDQQETSGLTPIS